MGQSRAADRKGVVELLELPIYPIQIFCVQHPKACEWWICLSVKEDQRQGLVQVTGSLVANLGVLLGDSSGRHPCYTSRDWMFIITQI